MSSLAAPELNPARAARVRRAKLNQTDRRGNRWLRWLALAGGSLLFVALAAAVFMILSGSQEAFSKYGIGFIFHSTFIATPSVAQFGAGTFIFGTLVTAVGSLILSTILGVSIGLFLALLAPRRVAAVVGPLVELLAAIPSVILGLIGIALLCPFIAHDLEPPLHGVLGWTGLFGSPLAAGNSLFAGILILTIMIVPIVAALSRDLFSTVPIELRDGAEALGATRWEMIKAVVLPTTRSGVIAACMLGFGRAAGEAIAIEQVVGGSTQGVSVNLFHPGNTISAIVAAQFENSQSHLETSVFYYLLAILLVIVVITILIARWIAGDFKALGGDGAEPRGLFPKGISFGRAQLGMFKRDTDIS